MERDGGGLQAPGRAAASTATDGSPSADGGKADAPPPPPPPPLPLPDAAYAVAVSGISADESGQDDAIQEQQSPRPQRLPSSTPAPTTASNGARRRRRRQRGGAWGKRHSQPDDDDENGDNNGSSRHAAHRAGRALPPGVAPVSDFISIFCSVSAVALTLLATTLPMEGTTREEERRIHRGLLYYMLCAITVLLFFFKMQTSLEHSVLLLAIDQLMLATWLLGLVLLPVFLRRVIRYGHGRGSAWNWTVAMTGNSLLLADYLLLASANLGFDASLCWHPHHRAMVYPRGQAARERRLRNAAVCLAGLVLLGLLELFVEDFTHEYVLIVPLLLAAEHIVDIVGSRRQRHHHHRRPPSPHPGPSSSSQHSDTSSHVVEAPRMEMVESADRDSSSDDSGGAEGGGSGSSEAADDDEEAGGGGGGSGVTKPQQPLPPPPQQPQQPPPATPLLSPAPTPLLGPQALMGEPSVLSVASAAAIRTDSVPARRLHPPPRVARHVALPWWYRLRVKRLKELQELFHGTTGTALTLLGTELPFLRYDGVGGQEHLGRFSTCLFMYFWAAMAVLLYHTRMRQLLSFRRFLFFPEVILICVWMILIVLIPKLMESVVLFGGGHGDIGEWTPAQVNNTRLLVVHIFLDACTANFAASLLYWERKVGAAIAHEERGKRRRKEHPHLKEGGPPAAGAATTNGFSLTKLVVIEAARMALSVILLGCQMSIDSFSNQFVYIIPVWMLVTEAYVHFYAGRSGGGGGGGGGE